MEKCFDYKKLQSFLKKKIISLVLYPLKKSHLHLKILPQGCLGGSVGKVSDFSLGHDFAVPKFQPCADSSEPGVCFRFCVSLSLCPSPACSLSLKSTNLKKLKNNNKETQHRPVTNSRTITVETDPPGIQMLEFERSTIQMSHLQYA